MKIKSLLCIFGHNFVFCSSSKKYNIGERYFIDTFVKCSRCSFSSKRTTEYYPEYCDIENSPIVNMTGGGENIFFGMKCLDIYFKQISEDKK